MSDVLKFDIQTVGSNFMSRFKSPVYLCIASVFSQEMLTGNVGQASALDSMGAKQ